MDWRSLEDLPGLVAVPAAWRARLRDHFETFNDAFLRKRSEAARSVPCPHGCGCAHEVVRHDDGRLVGVCRCEPWNCDDLTLLPADVEVKELNVTKLGRAVAKAFGATAKESRLPVRGAAQIGRYGAAALPLVLVIVHGDDDFRLALSELIARLEERFLVFAPSVRFYDANAKELLAKAKAGFFALESQVTLLPSGVLLARNSGEELFSRFVPELEDTVTQSEAARVFELLKTLSDGPKPRKAPLQYVFQAVVLEGRTQEWVAKECDCTPGLVSMQVRKIEARMNLKLEQLQALASRVAEMKASTAAATSEAKETGINGDGDEDNPDPD
jgi:hypothetical protein